LILVWIPYIITNRGVLNKYQICDSRCRLLSQFLLKPFAHRSLKNCANSFTTHFFKENLYKSYVIPAIQAGGAGARA
jgi:hypothetical protein